MRIGYLTSQYPAASHTFIRREVAALRRAGLDLATFSVRRPDDDEIRSADDRAAFAETQYVLPVSLPGLARAHIWAILRKPARYLGTLRLAWRHRAPGTKAGLWSLFHFAEAVLLARMLTDAGIDRLHNHFANSGASVGMLAAHYLEIPWSLTLHGISETDYPAGLLLPDKLARADFAACVSWFGRAQAMRISAPALWDKLILVRCGVDPAVLPARRNEGSEAAPRIVCVGRLSPEKGQAGLIAQIAALHARGINCTLDLVGDGPQRGFLDGLVARYGLKSSVRFLGRLAEPETLDAIAGADLLVVPSFMEGLPVVLMEAMALRVPVISSQVAGIPELVQDGVTGLLYPPSDWDAMGNAIARLIADPALAKRLADAAHQKVMAEFAIDVAVAPLRGHFRPAAGISASQAASLNRPIERSLDSSTAP
ncbi:MAG: glycosyltransferase family 4 protein [Proteobacteria bacterium]|nr:glycosyltransferase family 4 protein [Pseudomonadota bacterium]